MSIDAVEGKTYRTQIIDNMTFHSYVHLNIQIMVSKKRYLYIYVSQIFKYPVDADI